MTLTIDHALTDGRLLGAGLGDAASWSSWRAVLKAAFALELSDDERLLFASLAGGRSLPTTRVSELWCVAGRRSGKSRIASAVSCWLACAAPRDRLASGEIGEVVLISPARDQANTLFSYCLGFLELSPVLKQEIESVTRTEIRLRGNVVLSTRAGNFRTLRGRSLLACVLDEVAFLRDETSAYADVETYRALLPALSTTGGMLIGISTPYRRVGLLHQKHKDYFGVDDASTLVVAGGSQAFNPTLATSVIDRARASDPEGSRAEWDAEFRSDLASFLDDSLLSAIVDYSRPLELPPVHSKKYSGFVDPSGGRHDAFTICIGHKAGDAFIADVIWGTKPPFDPAEVAATYSALVKDYRISQVHGDNYSGDWVVNAFKDNGIRYQRSEKPKSQLYLEALPLFTRELISIPDLPPLLKELRLLERQTHRSGKHFVDHGRYGSDDFANALCGCAVHVAKHGYDSSYDWVTGTADHDAESAEWKRLQLQRSVGVTSMGIPLGGWR